MPIINITVRNKVAAAEGSPRIVCGNSDYVVKFDFDEEFAAYTEKTLCIVFRRRGKMKHYNVLFNGDSAFLPPVYETDMCAIGVYAGNLISSTVVMIPCDYCAETEHHDPPPDIYEQLLEYLAGLQGGGSMTGQMTAILGGTPPSPAGYAAEAGFVYNGTAASSAQFTVSQAGNFKLMVIALNSEASTYALNLAVQVNGSAVETEAVAYNAYSGSGTNRRNHRVVSYSADFAAGDTVKIDLTERSGYTSFVYALLDETYPFSSLMQTVSTADATASGSYSADAIALYGTFDSSTGGTIHIADAAAGTAVTTDNPGTNYKSAYIFWFEKEGA